MSEIEFYKEILVTIVRPAGKKVSRKMLDDPNATFVWGELMNPHFIEKLLGSPRAYSPAVARGFIRKPTKTFFDAVRNPSGAMQGVVLLGLSKKDVDKLNEFEQVGKVMERHTTEVSIGQMKRKTYIYLKKR